jgi:hypothetical protein
VTPETAMSSTSAMPSSSKSDAGRGNRKNQSHGSHDRHEVLQRQQPLQSPHLLSMSTLKTGPAGPRFCARLAAVPDPTKVGWTMAFPNYSLGGNESTATHVPTGYRTSRRRHVSA